MNDHDHDDDDDDDDDDGNDEGNLELGLAPWGPMMSMRFSYVCPSHARLD
jgi:hypothetical protein